MPCKRPSLSIEALLGEPGGGSFAGTFERKEKYILVPFWEPEAIEILNLGGGGI